MNEKRTGDQAELASYRRLIDLQKQMIELAQQFERTRKERDSLRSELARELRGQIKLRTSAWRRLLKRISGFTMQLQKAEVRRMRPSPNKPVLP